MGGFCSTPPRNCAPAPKGGVNPLTHTVRDGFVVPKLYPTAHQNLIYHGTANPIFKHYQKVDSHGKY